MILADMIVFVAQSISPSHTRRALVNSLDSLDKTSELREYKACYQESAPKITMTRVSNLVNRLQFNLLLYSRVAAVVHSYGEDTEQNG